MADSYGFAACYFCESILAVSKLEKVIVPARFGDDQKQGELAKPKSGVEANACEGCVGDLRTTRLLTATPKRRK